MRWTEEDYAAWQRRQDQPGADKARKPSAVRLPAPTEQAEQEMVIQWARTMQRQRPELEWLHHIPNGGVRDPATAAMLQRAGVLPGVPDLCLPVPQPRPDGGDWHGLYVEMKRSDHSNAPTAQQKRWIDYLRASGYMAVVCYGAGEAIEVIERYLGAVNRGHCAGDSPNS